MTQVQLPRRPSHNDFVQDNDEAILRVLNGDVRDDNVAEKAAISGAKIDFSKTPAGVIPPTALPPGTTLPAGSTPGQVLMWNGSAWVPSAPAVGDAQTLDGLDSTNLMRRTPAGSQQMWWGSSTATINASGIAVHSHGLGILPTFVLVTISSASPAEYFQGVHAMDGSTVHLKYPTTYVSSPSTAFILVIG